MIQITFTPETPEQAAVVAEAIGKYLGAVSAGATVAEVAEAPKKTRKAEAPIKPDVAPKAETVNLEQVRAKLTTLSQDGKKNEVAALIAEFGASKLTEVKFEDYAALLAKAEAL